eukprot:2692426-Amphidinium_carterae.1
MMAIWLRLSLGESHSSTAHPPCMYRDGDVPGWVYPVACCIAAPQTWGCSQGSCWYICVPSLPAKSKRANTEKM